MEINITRSQVAQLYVELTNDNLKEVFIVEGDEVVETPIAPVEVSTEEVVPSTEETVAPTGDTAITAADSSDVQPSEPETTI